MVLQFLTPHLLLIGPSKLFCDLSFLHQYALLTGIYPFYDECHSKKVHERVKKGDIPRIHPYWKRASPGEAALVDIIQQCWLYNPGERIAIGNLVLLLRKAVDDNRRLQLQNQTAAVVPRTAFRVKLN
jgi:hypothetical protein